MVDSMFIRPIQFIIQNILLHNIFVHYDFEKKLQSGEELTRKDLRKMMKNYEKEDKKGWMIPLFLNTVRRLANARIMPGGVAPQSGSAVPDSEGFRFGGGGGGRGGGGGGGGWG